MDDERFVSPDERKSWGRLPWQLFILPIAIAVIASAPLESEACARQAKPVRSTQSAPASTESQEQVVASPVLEPTRCFEIVGGELYCP